MTTSPSTSPSPEKSRATLSLVLAAASWLGCAYFASIPALVLATFELKGIRLGRRPVGGRRAAVVAAVLAVLNILVVTVVAAALGSLATAGLRAAKERVTVEASDGTARVQIPGLWKVPEVRDPGYILEANAPAGIAAFNAVRLDEDEETTLETAAQVTMESLRGRAPSLKILEERRATYAGLPAIELDTSLEMDGQELRTYFAFVDGAHGIYQLTGTSALAVDHALGPVIKGIFASFTEVGPPTDGAP